MIDKEKVYAYFFKFHGPITPSTNGWYDCTCPFCGKPKFAINLEYMSGKCWKGCFNGYLVDVIQRYHGIGYFEAREFIDAMEPTLFRAPYAVKVVNKHSKILPNGYKPILTGNNVLANRARNYLIGRGFDLNYLDMIGVGYCDESHPEKNRNYFGYIIIPFKRRGAVVYFIGRSFIGDAQRYKNPGKADVGVGKADFFFNEEALYSNHKVYAVEGWACAATLKKQGISMQGSKISVIQRNIILHSPVNEVVFIPDAGYYNNGLEMAYEIIQYKKVKVLNLNQFQADGLGKDVNEIGAEHILKLEEDTPWLDMTTLFKETINARPSNSH